MSITVTPNSNGTVTITCGSETITIGTPAPPNQHTAPDIPPIWPSGGVTASLIASPATKTEIVDVASATELLRAIKDQHDLRSYAADPALLQFNVRGREPLQVAQLNELLAELGNPTWMGIQIKMTGDHYE